MSSLDRQVLCVLSLLSLVFVVGYVRLALAGGFAADSPPRLSVSLAQVAVVAQRVRVVGYERSAFGAGWGAAPDLGDSCTTREFIMVSSLADARLSSACDPVSGTARDPYSGLQLEVGVTPIEVDHVFPLRAAWDMGAHSWTVDKRVAFANDPLNLVATSKTENQDKSDALPGQWLPSSGQARCWYVRRVAQVAANYQLPLSVEDVRVMRRQCWVRELLPR